MLDKAETRERIRESLFAVLERDGLHLEADGPRRWRALCPFHSERTPSFKVWREDGRFYCFGCGEHGDAADYVARRYGLDRRSDFREILGILGIEGARSTRLPHPRMPPIIGPEPPPSEPLELEAYYFYNSADWKPVYQVRRYKPKTFRQFHHAPDGRWLPGLNGAGPLLYRLPQLLEANPEFALAIFEGEKDVDLAWQLGMAATCNSGGAGNWPHSQNHLLQGRDVVIFPDNDERGKEHAEEVARGLWGIARMIRIVQLPGLEYHGDFSDWIDGGHTMEELDALCREATGWVKVEPDPLALPETRPVADDLSWVISIDGTEEEPVRWLWPGYIPLHDLTILDGDPGLGKSAITLDLAARVSSGAAMPDGSRGDLDGPAGVLLFSCENSIAQTVKPRLRAAGADISRVRAVQVIPDGASQRMPTLLDIEKIELAIRHVGARLVVIDPLMAYMPGEVNSFRDQDVRRVLAPLSALAQELGVAVVVVRHLNKAGGNNPLYRGGGSIGIIGAARVGLLVAADPQNRQQRILAQTKNNLARTAPSLAFHLSDNGADGMRVSWDGTTSYDAHALLADPEPPKDEDNSKLARARNWLYALLYFDGARGSREIYAAARESNISAITLRRAAAELGVKKTPQGFGADQDSYWHLTNSADVEVQANPAQPQEIGLVDA